MNLKSRLNKRAKLAKAKLDNYKPLNPSLKPLHTEPFVRSRVLTISKAYKRNKHVEVSDA